MKASRFSGYLVRKVYAWIRRGYGHCKFLGIRDGLVFTAVEFLRGRHLIRTRVGAVNLYLRSRTPDLEIALSVFRFAEYDSLQCANPRVIVDAGAYSGISSVYFARRYQAAQIIAIEPDEENFELLLLNTAIYKNVSALKAALWCSDCTRPLRDPHSGPWGYTITDSNESNSSKVEMVECLRLTTLMNRLDIDHIDILKLDVEGAEKEIFESCGDWVNKVDVIVVELHDRLRPGCAGAFEAATAGFGQFAQNGEKVTAYRNRNAWRREHSALA